MFTFFGLLCLLVFICFAWLACEARAVEHQELNEKTPFSLRRRLVKFLIFNLPTLVWLELGLLDLLDLLVGRLVLLRLNYAKL